MHLISILLISIIVSLGVIVKFGGLEFISERLSPKQEISQRQEDTLGLSSTPTLVKDEFQLNSISTGYQDHPFLAKTNNGNFAATWMGYFSSSTGSDIMIRSFDSTGKALQTADARVNTTTAGDQQNSFVATDGDTRAVVVWTDGSFNCSNTCKVKARVYLNNKPLTGEIQVNPTNDNSDPEPHPFTIMVKSGIYKGYFLVSWNDTNSAAKEWKHYIRVYKPNGTAHTNPILINQSTSIATGALSTFLDQAPSQYKRQLGLTRLDANQNGDAVAVWEKAGDKLSLYYRLFNPFTNVYQEEIELDTPAQEVFAQVDPGVSMNSSGNFVVSWSELPTSAPTDELTSRIYAKIVPTEATDSARIDLPSDTSTTGYVRPHIQMRSTGEIIAAWSKFVNSNINEADVYMRSFSQTGTPYQASDILVSSTPGKDWHVSFDFSENVSGNMDQVIAWDRYKDATQLTNVYAKLYRW